MASILIVDDSLIMRRNLRTILERNGHQIIAEATNGEDAIRLYELHHPDLVTMDITMPILNGIEAVKRITALHAEANIIVISAFDQRNMLFEAMENGAKHYIIKPITEAKLLQAVRTMLEALHSRSVTEESILSHSYITSSKEKSPETISVVNNDGRFIIQLPNPLLPEHMNACRMALQGLMFIRPLHLTIDFQSLSMVQPTTLHNLQEIANLIQQADGQLYFKIKEDKLRNELLRSVPSVKIQGVIV